MRQLHLFSALSTLLFFFLFAAQGAEPEGKPTVRVTPRAGGITVEASDSDGLDSLEIVCAESDSTYHTQLSRSAPDLQFHRSFSLSELFPSLADRKSTIRLEVTVRNTRGITASATVSVAPTQSNKGS